MRSSEVGKSPAAPPDEVVQGSQVLTVAALIMRSRRDSRIAAKYVLTLGTLSLLYVVTLIASMLAISSPFWRTAVAVAASALFVLLMSNAQRVLRRL